jgi:Coenzyme PQQ synthesis protein D (PqqD)
MFGRKPKPRLSRDEALAMKPVHLVDQDAMKVDAAGNGKLVVPVPPPRFARWLAAKFENRTKTFEFDSVGVYVWGQIDGKTSVEQLIRRLAKQYNLDLRQAEASTTAFLKMLLARGLIGMPVDTGR